MIVKCLAQEHNTMTPPGLEPRPLDAEFNTQTIRSPCVHHCVSDLSNYYGMHGWPHGIMVTAPDSRSKVQTLCFFFAKKLHLYCASLYLGACSKWVAAIKQSRNLLKCWEGGKPVID